MRRKVQLKSQYSTEVKVIIINFNCFYSIQICITVTYCLQALWELLRRKLLQTVFESPQKPSGEVDSIISKMTRTEKLQYSMDEIYHIFIAIFEYISEFTEILFITLNLIVNPTKIPSFLCLEMWVILFCSFLFCCVMFCSILF